MISCQSHGLIPLVAYNFGHDFYNKTMIQARRFKYTHTKHEYESLRYSIVIKNTYTIYDYITIVNCVGYIHDMEL